MSYLGHVIGGLIPKCPSFRCR